MNITIVFAELMIIGLQVGGWLFLLSLLLFGTTWTDYLVSTTPAGWVTIFLTLLLSFLYTLGILFDRLTDSLFDRWETPKRKKMTPKDADNSTRMRFLLGDRYKDFEAQFEYTKSRVRIMRSSTVNFSIYTIIIIALIWLRLPLPLTNKWFFSVVTLVAGVVLARLSFISWDKLVTTYLGQIRKAYGVHLRNNIHQLNNSKDLEVLLESIKLEKLDEWGKGDAKTIDDLWNEISHGETTLQQEPLARVVDVVQLIIRNKNKILYETEQLLKDGRRRSRSVLPSEKKRNWETYQEAAHRCLKEEFGIESLNSEVLESTYRQRQEYKESISYPSLSALFRYHIVEVNVRGIPSKDFWTNEDLEENKDDPVSKHFWSWKNVEEMTKLSN